MPLPAHAGVSFRQYYGYDREDTKGAVPSSAVLSRLAQLRLEPDSDDGSGQDVVARCWINLRRSVARVPRSLGCGLQEVSGRSHIERGGQTLHDLLG